MNLCLVCRDVSSDPASGLVRATCDLARALAGEGHQVHLVTDVSGSPPPDLPGVMLRRVLVLPLDEPPREPRPESALHNLMHAAAVYREVKRIHEHEGPVDAVLAPLWRSLGAICLLDQRFPTIVSCMTSLKTLTEIDEAYWLLPDLDERLSLERETLVRSRYLHGLTQAVLAKTIRDYDLDPVETAVVARGLRDRCTPSAPARVGTTRVLSVGRIERRKGVDVLLKAAWELVDDGFDVSFTLAGPRVDPELTAMYATEAAKRPQRRDAVRLTGAVSDAELDRLYSAADVVCAPSRYESHGIVLVEAMMFGKAVVTCDAGGIGEVVEPGRTAIVAPPGDAPALAACLRRVIGDPRLRDELGSAGRNAFQARFEAQTVARRMQGFIERVLTAHDSLARETGDIERRLERLVCDVLALEPQPASVLAAQLLDPIEHGLLSRLRALSVSTPASGAVSRGDRARVTAVVMTRDRPELLTRALDSLEKSRAPLEVVVVDNDSNPPATQQVAADCARRPNVRLVHLDRRVTCAEGRQTGVALADGELALLLDDDAELMPDAIDHLLAELDTHPEAAAVAATVIGADGRVLHSGGSVQVSDGLATFALIGQDSPLSNGCVPASGPAGWTPGAAVLIRRDLLLEHPIDTRMAGWYDSEWSYRVALERPGSLRRCRDALALHHNAPKPPSGPSLNRSRASVDLLVAHARFYERHGLLLAPWLFDHMPDLRAVDGTYDLAGARLLLELVSSKGTDWILAAWANGELDPLIEGRRHRVNLERETHRLRQTVRSQEETLAFLHRRHETLCRIEQGGWWQLRGRILPLLRLLAGLRATVRTARSRVGPAPGRGTRPVAPSPERIQDD